YQIGELGEGRIVDLAEEHGLDGVG
ncbi:MAG: hypothetical protein ACI9DF_005292, partial [Verrucomicrobiales bacterium]